MTYPILLHNPEWHPECIIEFIAPRCGTIVQEIPNAKEPYCGTSQRIGYFSNMWDDDPDRWKIPPIDLLRNCEYALQHYPELFI